MVHQTYRKPFDLSRTQHDRYNEDDVRPQEHDEVSSVHHTIPDTTPWGPPRMHFSQGESTESHKPSGPGPAQHRKVPGTPTGLDAFSEL